MPDKMNGENHSLVRLFLKSGFMKELDLTKGSVLKTLLQFAVPFLIANLLQALYGGADLFVVGWFDDAASVAAVAIGSQVMQTITGIILGLTTGTTVVIAMATGAKNYRDVATSIGTSICLFASVGLFLTLIMVVSHNYIAVLMHTPVEAMRDAKHYLLICSIGIPFIMGYNVVCGILRGLGDSKTPLYFVALACVINIVLDVVLVGFCHLRAAGAAIATVSSQGISFLTALWFLHKRGFHFSFSRRDIRLSPISFSPDFCIRSAYRFTGCFGECIIFIDNRYCQSNGCYCFGSIGSRRENYRICHVAPDGHILGGSYDDGTELRGKINFSYESLSLFGYRDGIGLRAISLHILAIPAGNLDGNIHERSGGCCRGGGIFARL